MTVPSAAPPDCPKNMVYGPCGGVGFDGTCEVAAHECVFLERDLARWPSPVTGETPRTPGAAAMMARLARGRAVVADFPARSMDVASLDSCARILAGSVDAVLVGDSGAARVQFPPAYRAHLIQQTGLAVWSGVNCRDRNRVALEGEMAALATVSLAGRPYSVAAVHCVTGDHPGVGHRPDAAPVFDLDSTRLAALARSRGHLVSVGESPATPPVDRRAARLAEKVRAGADVAFVNHCGPASAVTAFVEQLTPEGRPGAFIACIPVVVDAGSASLLRSFTSLVLPPGYLDRILAAGNPYTEGILAAVELGQQMLAVDGVAGVNLSGGPAAGQEEAFASAMAEIGRALKG